MPGRTIRIRSRDGGEFDCYLNTPDAAKPVPAVVLASAVHGVDANVRAIADTFASHGYIAAAPDLFWRSIPGPLPREDKRAAERSQPRLEKIKAGEADMADTLAHLRTLSNFNSRAAAMGFCYGGPYSILGPKRLGYAAGISCHGTQMLDFVHELDGVTQPVCILWISRLSARSRSSADCASAHVQKSSPRVPRSDPPCPCDICRLCPAISAWYAGPKRQRKAAGPSIQLDGIDRSPFGHPLQLVPMHVGRRGKHHGNASYSAG